MTFYLADVFEGQPGAENDHKRLIGQTEINWPSPEYPDYRPKMLWDKEVLITNIIHLPTCC